jgi:hypothetical protein
MKPRIFLGSSGQQEKLLRGLTRGLQDVAEVEPWTTVFNPGVSTLDRLVELTREVGFAAADPGDRAVLDGDGTAERAALIERRLEDWKSWANS